MTILWPRGALGTGATSAHRGARHGIGIAPDKLRTCFDASRRQTRRSMADLAAQARTCNFQAADQINRRYDWRRKCRGAKNDAWLTLTLPCVDPTALVTRGQQKARLTLTGDDTYLLSTTSDLNRELVTALLARLGHVVHQAADGAEAVTAVAATDYDLVLMNVQMPGMDGLAATRALREIERLAKLPIVAMTAQALPSQLPPAARLT